MVEKNDISKYASDQMGKNTTGLKDLDKAIKRNIKSSNKLQESIIANVDVLGNLQKVFMRSEKIQLQSLTLGTSYSKFVKQNTEALSNSIASTQAMTEALLTGQAAGLRDNTKELNNLLGEMTFLGQNTAGMIKTLADFQVLTGDSKDVEVDLIGSIRSNSKMYGVSTEKLGESLSQMTAQLEKQSLFGPEAVGALGEIKTSLLARTGGKGGSQIDILLSMLDAGKVQEQALFGLEDLAKMALEGNFTSNDLAESLLRAAEQTNSRLPSDPVARALAADTLGRSSITAITNLANLVKKDNALTSEMKADQDDINDTLKSKQVMVDKFYQQFAPEMHSMITRWLPAIAIGVGAGKAAYSARGFLGNKATAMGAGYSASRFMGGGRRESIAAGAGIAGKGLLGGAGMVSKLARGALAFAGPIGLGLTALTTFGPMIWDALSDGNKEAKEQTKNLKEMNARSKDPQAYKALQAATRMIHQLNVDSSGPTTNDRILTQLRLMNTNLTKVITNRKEIGPVD